MRYILMLADVPPARLRTARRAILSPSRPFRVRLLRSMGIAAGVMLAALLCAAPAAAQAVEGLVTESQTLQPVAGAQVQLVDSAGQLAAAAVTDGSGVFRLRAPGAGEYRLRAERVGLRTTLTRPVPVPGEGAVAVEVRMATEPVALDPVAAPAPIALRATRTGVEGWVLDDLSGQPLAGATVTLLNVREQRAGRAVTDSLGRFHLRVPHPGGYQLRAERLGFRPSTSSSITVTPSDSVQVELRLSTASVLLAPLTVVAASRQVVRDHQLAGFEWRRTRQPFGRYMGPDEIRRLNPFLASDVLQNVGFVRVEGGFDRVVTLPMRMGTFTSGARCIPNLYVDGNRIRLGDGFTVDGMVGGSSVAAVEVYDSPVTAPAEFPARDNPFCGVVVIWTRVAGTRG